MLEFSTLSKLLSGQFILCLFFYVVISLLIIFLFQVMMGFRASAFILSFLVLSIFVSYVVSILCDECCADCGEACRANCPDNIWYTDCVGLCYVGCDSLCCIPGKCEGTCGLGLTCLLATSQRFINLSIGNNQNIDLSETLVGMNKVYS